MPTYEYGCSQCGEHLEIVQSIHDDALTECPNCGGSLRKKFGNVGIVFKGSGFYKTDSRASPNKTSASGSKSSESSSSGQDKSAEGGSGSTTDTATTKSTSSTDKGSAGSGTSGSSGTSSSKASSTSS